MTSTIESSSVPFVSNAVLHLPFLIWIAKLRRTYRSSAPPPGQELLPHEWSVMQALGELYPQQKGLGRQGIVRACVGRGVAISEHEVRLALDALMRNGWLTVNRGRRGTQLSEAGYQRYQVLLNHH